MSEIITLDGESLRPEQVEAIARDRAEFTIAGSARERVRESRKRIEDILSSDSAVYGVNTGFGELVSERIPDDNIETLQQNLIRSHTAGVGNEVGENVVRAMMVTRLNTLLKGYSGVREIVIDTLSQMLEKEVHPVVNRYGSLGASGDLAPLAQLALVTIGEGTAEFDGERLPGDVALERAGITPLNLAAKEGLAMINGTQFTAGLASLIICDAERAIKAADIAGAMSTEVTMSTTASADPNIQKVRPHDGQSHTARNIREVTKDSEIIESHRDCDRIQDAYSIRCMPQVHGAVRDALDHLRSVVEIELNSATDNPLVFPADDTASDSTATDSATVISGGNFHGEPLALPLDYLVSALAEIASISERRIDRMLNPNVQEERLPPFLTEGSGLQSGYMMAQYTAADLVSSIRSMGRPSMTNVPVSGNQEDHVSMSAGSARQAQEAVELARLVIGIELTCASQALDYFDKLDPGTGTKTAHRSIRRNVDHLADDRPINEDIESVTRMIRDGTLVSNVEDGLDIQL